MKGNYCRQWLLLGSLLLILLSPAAAQCPTSPGCRPGAASNSNAAAFGMGIYNVTLGNINNTTAGTSDGYQDYSCSIGTVLSPGLSYPVSIRTNANVDETVRVWIDFDNNGSFDPVMELFFSSAAGRLHMGASLPVPATAVLNQPLRLRVSADATIAPPPTPCSTPVYSQVEDYRVTLQANTLPPVAGFTIGTAQACAGTFAFQDASLRGATSWRWRFGDGTSSTQQNPTHTYASPGTYAVTLRACNSIGCDSVTRTQGISFFAAAPAPAPCAPSTLNFCCGYGLTEVQVNDMVQASADGSAGYEDFSCTRRITVAAAAAVPLRLQSTANAAQNFWVYLDLNNDGTFGANELIWQAENTPRVETFFVVPAGAVFNQPLRLRLVADATDGPVGACADRKRGQVEDYSLVVTPAPCAPTVVAGQINYHSVPVLAANATHCVMMLAKHSPNTRVQWQALQPNGANVWQDIVGATSPVFDITVPTSDTRRIRAVVSCGTSTAVTQEVEPATQTTRSYLHYASCSDTYLQRVALANTPLLVASACEQNDSYAYSVRSPTVPRYTATVRQGETYPLQVTPSRACRVSVFAVRLDRRAIWVGFKQTVAAAAGVPVTVMVPIDSSWATSGTTLLRVRCDDRSSNTTDAALLFDSLLGPGETEDYLVRVTPWQCGEITQRGAVVAPAQPVCANGPTELSLAGHSLGSRLQWQSSPDSLSWQDVAGATSRVLRRPITTPTYYRVRLQGCSTVAYTAAVRVLVQDHTACYCTIAGDFAGPTTLTRVRLTGTTLDNVSTSSVLTPPFVAYAPTAPARTATLVRGATYALSLTVNTTLAASAPTTLVAWLDLDRSGTYDSLEWVQLARVPTTVLGNTTFQVQLPVPARALLGTTGLRLRVTTGLAPRTGMACLAAGEKNLGRGETEDYVVTIVDAPCPAGPLTAGTLVVPAPLTCLTVLRSHSYSLGATLQWQLSRDQGITWTDVAGATEASYTLPFANRTAAEQYRLQARCGPATAVSAPVIIPAGNCSTSSCLTGDLAGSASGRYVDDVAIAGTTLANYGSGNNERRNASSHIRWPAQSPNWTATLTRGSSYSLFLTVEVYGVAGVWADWNHDGLLSASEAYGSFTVTPTGRTSYTLTLPVPPTAALGTTLLRVVMGSGASAAEGCRSYYSTAAEIEDYLLTVVDQPGPLLPTLTASLCGLAPLQLEASGAGANTTYSWLGPNGFAATGAVVTVPNFTPALAGTYVALAQRNGQRIATSVYVPAAPGCNPTATRAGAAAGALTVAPNPTSGFSKLAWPTEVRAERVRVRSLTGQLVADHLLPAAGPAHFVLNLSACPAGLYVVELQTRHGLLFAKLIRSE